MVWQEHFNRVDYPTLERRIIETYHRWHLKSLTVEVNGVGKGVIDHLLEEELKIIPFLTSNKSKQEIIQNLQVAREVPAEGMGMTALPENQLVPSGSFGKHLRTCDAGYCLGQFEGSGEKI